jgi:uncharacterized protein YlxW (UPF0749 family)
MSADLVGILGVAVLSLLGTAYAAIQARKTNTATVDVRIFELLQQDVEQLQTRVATLRQQLHKAQDESDWERDRRRKLESELEAIADVVDRMVRAMIAAELPVPMGVETYLRYSRDPTKAKAEEAVKAEGDVVD